PRGEAQEVVGAVRVARHNGDSGEGAGATMAAVTTMRTMIVVAAVASIGVAAPVQQHAAAGVTITVDRNWPTATRDFKLPRVASPSKDDGATDAKRTLVDGEADPNGATLSALTDGLLPHDEDEPGANFFFNAGSSGGAFRFDFGKVIAIAEIN